MLRVFTLPYCISPVVIAPLTKVFHGSKNPDIEPAYSEPVGVELRHRQSGGSP
jgi:hypothetical protein